MNNISQYIVSLFQCVCFGEFGILTTAPRYLFGILFPVMVFLELSGQVLTRFSSLQNPSPRICRFFYSFMGLGCTTLALAAAENLPDGKSRRHISLLLVFLIPCSAKLTIIAAFASLVTFRVFAVFFLLFLLFCLILHGAVSLLCPLPQAMSMPPAVREKEILSRSFIKALSNAFRSVCKTAPPFLLGSILISLAGFFGFFDILLPLVSPLLEKFTLLPAEAAEILFLGILKRDFAAAALLSAAEQGIFDAVQLTVLVLMLLFSAPCFNSAVIFAKQQKLPVTAAVLLGSLVISLIVGMISSKILFVGLL